MDEIHEKSRKTFYGCFGFRVFVFTVSSPAEVVKFSLSDPLFG